MYKNENVKRKSSSSILCRIKEDYTQGMSLTLVFLEKSWVI